jgi:Flp pilus assembly protein TadG
MQKAHTPTRARPIVRFVKNRDGASALEFAMIAPVLFTLFLGMFDSAFMMMRDHILSAAADDASRIMRTGQYLNASDPEQAFRDAVCARTINLMPCEDIYYDVRTFDNFQSVSMDAAQLGPNGEPTNFDFEPGGPTSVMAVRLLYNNEFATPFLNEVFGVPNTGLPLTATVIVRGEPWE